MATAEIKGRLSLDSNPFTQALRQSEAAATRTGKTITGVFSSLASPLAAIGPAIAAAFTGGAIASGVKGVFDFAEGLGDLSDQTGLSVGRLAVLGKAFSNAGLQAEDAGATVNRLQRFLVNASETGSGENMLDKLGLSALALRQMAPEQQMAAIGNAISAIRDPAERSTAAMEIFGKSGGRLLAVFRDPAFVAAGGNITGNAAILERNAESFANASIALNKAGGLFRSFYLGTAEAVAGPLVAILGQLEKVNLVKVGEGFGLGVIMGATALVQTLNAVKKSDFFPSMETVSAGLASAGKVFSDFVKAGAEYVTKSVEEAQRLGALFSGLGAPLAELFGGAVDVLRGKLMQAPLGMITVLGAGLDYVTDSLPKKLMSGMRQAAEYLQGAFSYVAEYFTRDFGLRLLGAATKFAEAITNPLAASKMLAEAAAGPTGKSLQQHLSQARGQLGSDADTAMASFSEYLTKASINIYETSESLSKAGKELETTGIERMTGATGSFGKLVSAASPKSTNPLMGATALGAASSLQQITAGSFGGLLGPGPSSPSAGGGASQRGNPQGGGLQTGQLTSGGLSGPGSDTGEEYRQRMAQTRRDVKFQNPRLAGKALEDAVQQREQQRKDAASDQKYRESHGGSALQPQAQAPDNGSADIVAAIEALEDAIADLMAK